MVVLGEGGGSYERGTPVHGCLLQGAEKGYNLSRRLCPDSLSERYSLRASRSFLSSLNLLKRITSS